jgi:hypothetical protein
MSASLVFCISNIMEQILIRHFSTAAAAAAGE